MPNEAKRWKAQRSQDLALRKKEARERHDRETKDILLMKYREIARLIQTREADLKRLYQERKEVEQLIRAVGAK